MTSSPSRAAVSLTTAALVVGAAVSAHADPAGRARTVHVTGHLHATTDAVQDTSLCTAQGGEYAARPTDAAYSGTSTYTGTFRGTGRFCGRFNGTLTPDGKVGFVETDTFTGTVLGCGAGRVTYVVHGYVSAVPDLASASLPATEDWTVVARSGRGGLRGIRSGSGHDPARINLDTSIDAEFRGLVSCVPSRP